MSKFTRDYDELQIGQRLRTWEYEPGPREIAAAMAGATQHYLAVRAAAPDGVKPLEGGPSFAIGTRGSLASFDFAAGMARGWWPQATTFEIIQSDAQLGQQRADTAGMPPSAIILRQATPVIQFTCAPKPPEENDDAPPRMQITGGHKQ